MLQSPFFMQQFLLFYFCIFFIIVLHLSSPLS
nr:MAG TPA: hypothetical protein [Caudoviricetes sp.]